MALLTCTLARVTDAQPLSNNMQDSNRQWLRRTCIKVLVPLALQNVHRRAVLLADGAFHLRRGEMKQRR